MARLLDLTWAGGFLVGGNRPQPVSLPVRKVLDAGVGTVSCFEGGSGPGQLASAADRCGMAVFAAKRLAAPEWGNLRVPAAAAKI